MYQANQFDQSSKPVIDFSSSSTKFMSSIVNWALNLYHDNYYLKKNYKKFNDLTTKALIIAKQKPAEIDSILLQTCEIQKQMRDLICTRLRINLGHYLQLFSNEIFF